MRLPLHLLPLVLLIVTVGSWFVTYLVAVSRRDVTGGWPYISDTGTRPPESCIFGQFLNTSAALACVVVILKYMHVEVTLQNQQQGQQNKCSGVVDVLNKLCLVLGIVSAFGTSLVANFQVQNVYLVHMIGALVAFVIGVVYCWIITGITFILLFPVISKGGGCRQQFGNTAVLILRILLSLLSVTALVLTLVFDKLATNLFRGRNSAHWYPRDPGYEDHTISTTAEWAMSSSVFIFISTFAYDFRAHRVKRPRMHRRENTNGGGGTTSVVSYGPTRSSSSMSTGDSENSNNNAVAGNSQKSTPALTLSNKHGANFSVLPNDDNNNNVSRQKQRRSTNRYDVQRVQVVGERTHSTQV